MCVWGGGGGGGGGWRRRDTYVSFNSLTDFHE